MTAVVGYLPVVAQLAAAEELVVAQMTELTFEVHDSSLAVVLACVDWHELVAVAQASAEVRSRSEVSVRVPQAGSCLEYGATLFGSAVLPHS